MVLSEGVYTGETQIYSFPELQDSAGAFRLKLVDVEYNKEITGDFILNFDGGAKLKDDGILIYLAKFKDNGLYYVYFVSGNKQVCYCMDENALNEWNIIDDTPSLRRIPHANPWFMPSDRSPNATWELMT